MDEGFSDDGAPPFDRGTVEVRPGAPTMDLTALQTPLSWTAKLRSMVGILLTAGTGVGLFYLFGKTTLVRTGQLALTRSVTGDCRALGRGLHLVDTVFCDVRKASLTDAVVQLGTLHILRIPPGYVGLATCAANAQPVLLAPGVHLVNDPLFVFLGTQPLTENHINIGSTAHIITVAKGEIGLVNISAVGHFLGAGRHVFNHERISFEGVKPANCEYLRVGSKHRVLLPSGRLGLAWISGQPLILEPSSDPLCFDSATFRYDGSVSATQQVIRHGSLKIAVVRMGFVGVAFRDGVLDVLQPGLHRLSAPTHSFSGFLATGQQTLTLPKVVSMTSDNVALEFDAAITVQIVERSVARTGCSIQ